MVDPKDITNSEDINLILKELESSADKTLITIAREIILMFGIYKIVKIYSPFNSTGILNNIASFSLLLVLMIKNCCYPLEMLLLRYIRLPLILKNLTPTLK